MTVRPSLMAWFPSFACISTLGACRSEAGVDAAAEFDDFANAECNVTPHAAYEAPAGSAGMAGTGLDLVVSGTSTSDFTSKRFIAAGAPTALTTGGKLRVIEASRSTGLVTTLKQTFLAPVLSKSFGTSAYAANWRDCHTGADGAGFWDGCGQEILVGAPDIGHGTTGLVYWFEPTGFLFVLPEPWAGDAVQVYDDVDMIDFVLALMDLDGEGLTAGQEILRGVIALAAPTADFTLTFDETAGTLSMSIAMDTSAQNLLNSVPDMSSTACGMQAIDMTLVSPGACE